MASLLDKVSLIVFHLLYALENVIDRAMSKLLLGSPLTHFMIPSTAQVLERGDIDDLVGQEVSQLGHVFLQETLVGMDRVTCQRGRLVAHVDLVKEFQNQRLGLLDGGSGLSDGLKQPALSMMFDIPLVHHLQHLLRARHHDVRAHHLHPQVAICHDYTYFYNVLLLEV